MLRGVAAIIAGIVAISLPLPTLVSLMWVFGLFSIADGAVGVVLGMRGEPDGTVWWTMIILGVLAIAAGILAFAWPGMTALILLTIIAWSAILRGVFEIAAAIKLRKHIDDEWVLVLSGLLSIAVGVMLLTKPGAGLVALVLLVGAYMMCLGVMAVALSLRLRRLQHKLAP
jgi:uncharacterized membrane protein HdeD (DUF308 family)